MMFFTMLVMYSAFVLTSISTKYYVQDIARVFEYYVYFWGAGDFIEELISCFVSFETFKGPLGKINAENMLQNT